MQKIIKRDVFWAIILFLCLLMLSFRFLFLWFITDDTSCIYASTKDPLKLFFDRDTYLLFNKMFYSPLLPLSFKLDFMLFRLNPVGYHIHNLLAAFLTGLMSYRVYRLYLPRFESWIGTFLFVLSYPVITNIGWITRKHYIWGTFFTLLSFYLFKKSEFKKGIYLFLLSNIFYLIALLFKEAFALLPAVIFVLADGRLKDKVLKSTPYLLILCAYLMLRFYIIGGLGGYIGVKIAHSMSDLIKNNIAQLNLFSSTIWGLKILFIIPVLLALFVLNIRVALAVIVIFLITTAPFLFLKTPAIADNYYTFYFPSKFMLPMIIFSGALSVLLQGSKTIKTKIPAFAIVLLLFVLQIEHARDSYAFIKQSAESYKGLTSEALNKSRGGDILIVHDDAIFYNYLYETILEIPEPANKNMGTTFTFNDPDIPWLLKHEYSGKIKYLYLKNRWVDMKKEMFSISRHDTNDSIPEPQIRVGSKGHFLSFAITDKREGIFYGVLKSTFSDRNIGFQSMPLPKDVPIKIGLTEGKEIVYLFYCAGNQCSRPLVLKPTGGSA